MRNRCTRCGNEFVPWRPSDEHCDTCRWLPARPTAQACPVAKAADAQGDPRTPDPPILVVPLQKREAAIVWLAEQLASGPMACLELERRATAAGIAVRTLRRGKAALAVRSVQVGGAGVLGFWAWVLPQEGNGGR